MKLNKEIEIEKDNKPLFYGGVLVIVFLIMVTASSVFSSNGIVTKTLQALAVATSTQEITVSQSTSPASQNIVMGETGVVFGLYNFNATGYANDVRIDQVRLPIKTDVGASYPTNCFLYDGAIRLNSAAVNPTSDALYTFAFTTPLTIPKGTIKSALLKCDVPVNLKSGDTIEWKLSAGGIIQATDLSTGATVLLTVFDSPDNQNKLTLVSSGSLTVSLSSSSPTYSLKVAGTQNNVAGEFAVRASSETIALQRISLQLSNKEQLSGAADLNNVTLWNGSQQIGSATFTGYNRFATATLISPLIIPKDQTVLLTVKTDVAAVGPSQSGHQGAFIQIDYDGDDISGAQGIGQSSGNVIYANNQGDTHVNGFRMFRSIPTVASGYLTRDGAIDGRLLRFKVAASPSGGVSLARFSVTVLTNGTNVTNLNMFGYTDSGYSNPVSGVGPGGQLSVNSVVPYFSSSDTKKYRIYPQTSAGTSTVLVVPAGQTRYFEVRAQTSSTSGVSGIIATYLQGDSVYPAISSPVGTFAQVIAATTPDNQSFIWSGNATTTASLLDTDWSNAYGVVGLPSSGLLQIRSFATSTAGTGK